MPKRRLHSKKLNICKFITPQPISDLDVIISEVNDKNYVEKIGLSDCWYMFSDYSSGIRVLWSGISLFYNSKEIKNIPSYILSKLSNQFPFDGFLYANNFQLSLLNLKDNWMKVKFYVFDLPVKFKKYSERYETLNKNNLQNDFVIILKPILLKKIRRQVKVIASFLNDEVKKGRNSILLINKNNIYNPFINKNNIRINNSEAFVGTAEVISYHSGLHQNHKKLGKIKCKLSNGKLFYISKGFTEEEKNMYIFDNTFIKDIKKNTTKIEVPRIGDKIKYKYSKISKYNIPVDSYYSGILH
jgi:hypothetical protein